MVVLKRIWLGCFCSHGVTCDPWIADQVSVDFKAKIISRANKCHETLSCDLGISVFRVLLSSDNHDSHDLRFSFISFSILNYHPHIPASKHKVFDISF